jgi:hypothetical protein
VPADRLVDRDQGEGREQDCEDCHRCHVLGYAASLRTSISL